MHQAINHSFGPPWLRRLLDVHLLIQEQLLQWEPVVARARAWRLATVVWVVLDLARRLLGTAVPDEVLAAVALPVGRRWVLGRLSLDRALLARWPGGYRHRRFLIQTLLVDRPQDAVRLMWRALFRCGGYRFQVGKSKMPSASVRALKVSSQRGVTFNL